MEFGVISRHDQIHVAYSQSLSNFIERYDGRIASAALET